MNTGLKRGDRVEILESAYCGIDFIRVGDMATVVGLGAVKSALWVKFDAVSVKDGYDLFLILLEHQGSGWRVLKGDVNVQNVA